LHSEKGKDKNYRVNFVWVRTNRTTVDKGGVFTSASIIFSIETQPMNWKVLRKYEEVNWLREQLEKHYPNAIVTISEKTFNYSCLL
jgi:hypothetical protein